MNESCEKHCLLPVKITAILTLVALIVFLGFLSFYFAKKTALLGKPDNIRDSFTVAGHGEITAVPDIAIVNAGLETTHKDIAAGQKENTDTMNGFLSAVSKLGVAEKDRKTTNYSITPKYEYLRDGKQNLLGYTISNQAQLKIRDLSKISDVLALLGKFNLNQVGSFSFNIDNQTDLKSKALDSALTNAKTKADRIAKSGNIHLGRLISFSENGSYPAPMPYATMDSIGGGAMFNAAKAPTVEHGSQDVVVDVNATYEILP